VENKNIVYILMSDRNRLRHSQFKLKEEARAKLSEMPGPIELKIFSYHKDWRYSIVNGELLLKSTQDHRMHKVQQQPYIHFPDEAPKGLPAIEGFEYHGPYRLSPDKSLMLLSITPAKGGYVPRDFALVQMKSKKKYIVEDIAWSQDSNMYAVLDKSSRWSLGIPGIFFYLLGHPIDVGKFYLSIYDRKGNLLLRTKIATGVLGGNGQVSWEEKVREGRP
jgi:hypothetical protein